MNNVNQFDPYTGLVCGNLFNNLYEPYKNYKEYELDAIDEKSYLMLTIQAYGFAALDLNLYLDIYSNDENLIKLRDSYIKLYNQAVKEYESKYEILNLDSTLLNNKPWGWNKNPWPWEGSK